jgi:flagellar motor switch protein FliN
MSARIPEGPEGRALPGPAEPARGHGASGERGASSETRPLRPLLHAESEDAGRDSRELRAERRPVDAAAMETLLHDVPLEVSVELGRVRMPLGELAARLSPGSVIALDKAAGALLDVRVQSRLIARAEAVAIGERCGIRILELVGGNDS